MAGRRGGTQSSAFRARGGRGDAAGLAEIWSCLRSVAARPGGRCPGAGVGVGVVASQLIPVRVGDIQIEVEAVRVAGTEPTSCGKTERAAGNTLEAFGRTQDAILEVAKSTAQMIDRAGSAARLDRVEVESGLKFTSSRPAAAHEAPGAPPREPIAGAS
jgi:hypothetical protein